MSNEEKIIQMLTAIREEQTSIKESIHTFEQKQDTFEQKQDAILIEQQTISRTIDLMWQAIGNIDSHVQNLDGRFSAFSSMANNNFRTINEEIGKTQQRLIPIGSNINALREDFASLRGNNIVSVGEKITTMEADIANLKSRLDAIDGQ